MAVILTCTVRRTSSPASWPLRLMVVEPHRFITGPLLEGGAPIPLCPCPSAALSNRGPLVLFEFVSDSCLFVYMSGPNIAGLVAVDEAMLLGRGSQRIHTTYINVATAWRSYVISRRLLCHVHFALGQRSDPRGPEHGIPPDAVSRCVPAYEMFGGLVFHHAHGHIAGCCHRRIVPKQA
jgi:hypothetical protein